MLTRAWIVEQFQRFLNYIMSLFFRKNGESVLAITGRYNVTQYGIVGDGVTDNTVALQSMINSVPDGSMIYFPSGTYAISNTITITHTLTFVGNTYRKHYHKDTVSPGDSIILYTGTTPNINVFERVDYKGVYMRNLTFKANTFEVYQNDNEYAGIPYPYHLERQTVEGVNGLNFNRSANEGNVNIEECIFVGFSGIGLSVGQHKPIRDCVFAHCKVGVKPAFESILRGCWWNSCGSAIELGREPRHPDSASVYLQIDGGWADRLSQHFIFSDDDIEQVQLQITNFIVDACDKSAFYFPYANLYNSDIFGKYTRIGLKWAGIADADRTPAIAKESDVFYCRQIRDCKIFINSQQDDCGELNFNGKSSSNKNTKWMSKWFYTTENTIGANNIISHPWINPNNCFGNATPQIWSTKLFGQGKAYYGDGGGATFSKYITEADLQNYVTMAEVQAYVEELLNRNNGNDAV